MSNTTAILLYSVVAYLLGSIPNSIWIGKLFFGIDVREHGSGNAGATNTLRVLGKKAGFSVLFLDVFKGYAAVQLVYLHDAFAYSPFIHEYQMVFGAFAVIGHIYPVFAGFKGGKGIATLIGLVTGISWMLALACFITFVIIVAITKYISVGSMLSGIVSPIYAGLIYNWEKINLVYFCCVIAVLVVYTHRSNIKRLLQGNENKFSFNKKASQKV